MNLIRDAVCVALATTLLLGAASAAAKAQSEPASCRTVAMKVRSHPPSATVLWYLSSCPASGPAALAEVWSRSGVGSLGERTVLVNASGVLRDTRLLDAIVGVATDGSRASMDRIAALQVLMHYYDPRYAPSVDNLLAEPHWSSIAMQLDGPPPVDGTSPLGESTRPRIASTLARLAASERDTTVRRAALVLRHTLAYFDPENTPLAPGAITLVAGCGDRVTLRSTADVDVEVVLQVLDTTFEKTYGIRAGSQTKPTERLLGLPSGTVVASYGGREVARLDERNAPCPPWMVR